MDAPLTFEWDEEKAAANVVKHGVSFETAADAFSDLGGVTEADERFDYGEARFRLFASVDDFPLCVAFTRRGATVRIISARKANRKER